MGIRAHDRIGVGEQAAVALGGEDYRREVFQVDLVNDAGIGRHHAEVAERRLAPAQQGVAFLVALEFEQRVDGEGLRRAVLIHLDGVVDDQVDGDERVGEARVAAHGFERVAHGGQIHHAGDAGEILEQHARGHEADFARPRARPARHELDVGGLHRAPVLVAQQVLEQHADGIGQAGNGAQAGLLEWGERVDLVVAIVQAQGGAGGEGVEGRHLRTLSLVGWGAKIGGRLQPG